MGLEKKGIIDAAAPSFYAAIDSLTRHPPAHFSEICLIPAEESGDKRERRMIVHANTGAHEVNYSKLVKLTQQEDTLRTDRCLAEEVRRITGRDINYLSALFLQPLPDGEARLYITPGD